MVKKRAQIWVETVVYTLIGISIIGILLAIAKPKIDEIGDRLILEQTIESFNQINSEISKIQDSPGNQRVLGLKLSKGRIIFDGPSDIIYWQMESKYKYSQPGSPVGIGNLEVLTEVSNPYKIRIMLNYSNKYNLTIENEEKILELEESPTPHSLIFINKRTRNVNIELKK
jgi:hypothetical protein